MWASYISHKIRLGKFSQVDYNHDLTIGNKKYLQAINEYSQATKKTSEPL